MPGGKSRISMVFCCSVTLKFILFFPLISKMENVKSESQKFTQEDLKKIFEVSAKPLLFKYGYGGASRAAGRNNLILLRRHSLLKSKS